MPNRSPSPELAGAPAHPFRRDIQGLRALAVLIVVIFHAGLPLTGGFIGVDVFFVISGFVITGQLRTQLASTGRIDLGRFYTRRLKRLLPAAALTSVVTLVIAALVMSPAGEQQFAAKTAAAASFFVANVFLYRSGGGYFEPAEERNPFLHTWTLSVEEQFYLAMPLLLAGVALMWRRRSPDPLSEQGRRRLIAITFGAVAIAAVASFVLSLATTSEWAVAQERLASPARFAFYSAATRAWEFAAGVLVALLAPSVVARLAPWCRWVLAVGGLGALVWASVQFGALTPFPGTAALVPVLATVGLIVAGTGAPHPLGRVLEFAPFVWLGDRSYGWYLWHWPAIVLAHIAFPDTEWVLVAGAALSILPAALSYRWVENPIRTNSAISGGRLAIMMALCVLIPVGLARGVAFGADRQWGLEIPEGITERRFAVEADCDDYKSDGWSQQRCSVGAGEPTVLVLGDSHAASIFEGVAEAGEDLGRSSSIWFRSGCPFLVDTLPSVRTRGCATWQTKAAELVQTMQPDVVVVANRSAGYTLPKFPDVAPWRTITVDGTTVAKDQDEAIGVWGRGFEAMLASLAEQSIPVLVIDVVPEFASDFAPRMSLLRPDLGTPSVSMDDVALRRAAVLEAEHEVIERYDHVEAYDPAEELCGPRSCEAVHNGVWSYMDNHHLSPEGSRSLADSLEAAMDSLLKGNEP